MTTLIGRKQEQASLRSLLTSGSSEFAVVYGRRRVGKTFLIRETFNNNFQFQLTGLANATLKQQLLNFHTALVNYSKNDSHLIPNTWLEAFSQLIKLLEKNRNKQKVIFIDELPWLDTPKSNFISALEHFWNSWASARKDIILIVCGSAASWMLNKLINNKGGLHNRITKRIKLLPFTLHECEAFLKHKKINWNRYQLLEAYMAMGGIPFYLNLLEPGFSASQNIDKLFFSEEGMLQSEFRNLYASLFKHSENHEAVINALSTKAKGLTRDEILRTSKLPNGGGTTKVLEELEASGFIRIYTPFEKTLRDSIYQLTDFYSLFYYRFIKNKKSFRKNYWFNTIDSPEYRVWTGYAFELICLLHVQQIKKGLGIQGVLSHEFSWSSKNKKGGTQIDMIIDRKDQVINICEMKFSVNPFVIDKKYAQALRNKIGTFKRDTQTRKAVFLTLLTTYGIKHNQHSTGLVQNELTIDTLFE